MVKMDHFDQGIRQKCQGLEGGPETWLDLDWKKKKKKRITFRHDKSHQDSG